MTINFKDVGHASTLPEFMLHQIIIINIITIIIIIRQQAKQAASLEIS